MSFGGNLRKPRVLTLHHREGMNMKKKAAMKSPAKKKLSGTTREAFKSAFKNYEAYAVYKPLFDMLDDIEGALTKHPLSPELLQELQERLDRAYGYVVGLNEG
jgi:hypothetical protein